MELWKVQRHFSRTLILHLFQAKTQKLWHNFSCNIFVFTIYTFDRNWRHQIYELNICNFATKLKFFMTGGYFEELKYKRLNYFTLSLLRFVYVWFWWLQWDPAMLIVMRIKAKTFISQDVSKLLTAKYMQRKIVCFSVFPEIKLPSQSLTDAVENTTTATKHKLSGRCWRVPSPEQNSETQIKQGLVG